MHIHRSTVPGHMCMGCEDCAKNLLQKCLKGIAFCRNTIFLDRMIRSRRIVAHCYLRYYWEKSLCACVCVSGGVRRAHSAVYNLTLQRDTDSCSDVVVQGNLSIQRPTFKLVMLLQSSLLFATAALLCVQGQLPGKSFIIFTEVLILRRSICILRSAIFTTLH